MKISRLLLNESKWTKGCLGRDKNGNPINSFNILHCDGKEVDLGKDAVSFSLYGAVVRLYQGDGQAEVFLKLGEAVRRYSGRKIWLAQWNDEQETTFADIQAVLELANL
jgi:hypothetical protein